MVGGREDPLTFYHYRDILTIFGSHNHIQKYHGRSTSQQQKVYDNNIAVLKYFGYFETS
ncbi:MAG: hypothetical protein WBZ36_12795 [Candidatus Nitrosopolaris sp.]